MSKFHPYPIDKIKFEAPDTGESRMLTDIIFPIFELDPTTLKLRGTGLRGTAFSIGKIPYLFTAAHTLIDDVHNRGPTAKELINQTFKKNGTSVFVVLRVNNHPDKGDYKKYYIIESATQVAQSIDLALLKVKFWKESSDDISHDHVTEFYKTKIISLPSIDTPVVTLGYPKSLFYVDDEGDFKFSLSESSLGKTEDLQYKSSGHYGSLFVTSMKVDEGHSGSPVFTLNRNNETEGIIGIVSTDGGIFGQNKSTIIPIAHYIDHIKIPTDDVRHLLKHPYVSELISLRELEKHDLVSFTQYNQLTNLPDKGWKISFWINPGQMDFSLNKERLIKEFFTDTGSITFSVDCNNFLVSTFRCSELGAGECRIQMTKFDSDQRTLVFFCCDSPNKKIRLLVNDDQSTETILQKLIDYSST